MIKFTETSLLLWASYKNDKKDHNTGVKNFLIKTLSRILKGALSRYLIKSTLSGILKLTN